MFGDKPKANMVHIEPSNPMISIVQQCTSFGLCEAQSTGAVEYTDYISAEG